MNRRGGHRRWIVAALLTFLTGAGCSFLWWRGAVPPNPKELLSEIQRQHGIHLDRGQGGPEWTFDRIATEWGGLLLLRKDIPSENNTTSLLIRGWHCGIRTPTDVESGALVLGSGTIALGSGSTMCKRTPDGGFDCSVKSDASEGPTTFLIVAVPVGMRERIRYGVF